MHAVIFTPIIGTAQHYRAVRRSDQTLIGEVAAVENTRTTVRWFYLLPGETADGSTRLCYKTRDDAADTLSGVYNNATCEDCGRAVEYVDGSWIDPEASGDDILWRETCDSSAMFPAEHKAVSSR